MHYNGTTCGTCHRLAGTDKIGTRCQTPDCPDFRKPIQTLDVADAASNALQEACHKIEAQRVLLEQAYPHCSGELAESIKDAINGQLPMAEQTLELVMGLANGWLRVGNIEVSPSSMWKELSWEEGKAYCASLDCFMPDKEQLAAILEDKVIRAAIDGRRLMNDWFWTSSEYGSNLAWIQRPRDGLQDGYDKSSDNWVVPCCPAKGVE